ncbi:MAG: TIGR04282 family arsenosugar biosynthesis glycosyltransferase [Lentimonas sp.]
MPAPATHPTILLLLKAPRRGHVKTRLAHSIGAERALITYKALVKRQWQALPSNTPAEVHYTPNDAEIEMKQWLGADTPHYPQSEGDLGARLIDSINRAFERGARTVLCIGGDCPQLEAEHFQQATEMLDSGDDVVFGPSEDGGYYLIGLRSPFPQLFQDIPWSTCKTLEASLRQAAILGLKVGLLETLYDIDEASELDRAMKAGLIEL